MRVYFALLLTGVLCLSSFRRGTLSLSGTITAAFVGFTTASNDNMLFTAVLLAFFCTSTFWTKYQAQQKMKMDPSFAKSSQRDWRQVLSNGCVGSLISVVYQYQFDGRRPEELTAAERKVMTMLIWMYIAFYSCCTADTWASEIGSLNSNWPVLITTLESVPPGTNGGISKLGVLSSFAGGATVGLAADAALWAQYYAALRLHALPRIPYIMVGSLLGVLGSTLDSFLGATVQASYIVDRHVVSDLTEDELQRLPDTKMICGRNILSNNMVNVVASVGTVAAGGVLLALLL
ncbi:hypothetical protein COEREDRAFT_82600 [Coemansia reversa NRRL 1564]|uniref:DUF92-domain-containing protein n=1 Tax=Coemansia reversa (strain ATCC 12441 / NRRL 1564) TaxID=763665 RepID=A0A2G5B6V6_COERN|nr:hypothetical protein COEREDRAFT_82600 [Coemansia reversa NRRL 1564]|eukprot:PIA14724.1 hypothetical protein COEREDRAFT_82600 [Coemansia reversa NRRL 1564]